MSSGQKPNSGTCVIVRDYVVHLDLHRFYHHDKYHKVHHHIYPCHAVIKNKNIAFQETGFDFQMLRMIMAPQKDDIDGHNKL